MKMVRWYQRGSLSAVKRCSWMCLGSIWTYRIGSPEYLGIERIQNDGGGGYKSHSDTLQEGIIISSYSLMAPL